MEPRRTETENEKARRKLAARLVVLCAFAVCAGVLLFPGIEYVLSFRRESVSITAAVGETVRAQAEAPDRRMDINTASAQDLQSVPGIGPEMARRIMELREERQGFCFLEELMDVSGIGEKRFQALKEYFRCDPPDVQQPEAANPASF